MNFFERLDVQLKRNKMSKKQLAESLGIPYSTFLWRCSQEDAYDHISLSDIIKISQILDVPIGYWLEEEDVKFQKKKANQIILNFRDEDEIQNFTELMNSVTTQLNDKTK